MLEDSDDEFYGTLDERPQAFGRSLQKAKAPAPCNALYWPWPTKIEATNRGDEFVSIKMPDINRRQLSIFSYNADLASTTARKVTITVNDMYTAPLYPNYEYMNVLLLCEGVKGVWWEEGVSPAEFTDFYIVG